MPHPDGSPRKLKWLARVLALAAGFLTALALAEGAVRVSGFSHPLYPERIEFGYPDPTKLERIFEPDDALFWVPQDYHETVDGLGRVDLAFLGDSCTQFGTYDQLFVQLVEREFPERSVSTANLGVGGWSSRQGRAQMERDVPKLAPKVVTIYFGWNDHWIGFGIEDEDVARLNDSLLYKLRDVRLTQFTQVAFFGEGEQWPARVSEEQYADNLRAMVHKAREIGATPVLITAPSAHVPGREPGILANRWLRKLDDLIPLHHRYVEVVRRVAREEKAILLDAAERFDRFSIAERVGSYFLPDGIHLREAGDRLLAQWLVECLEENGLFERLLRPVDQAKHVYGTQLEQRFEPGVRTPSSPDLPTIIQVDKANMDPDVGFALEGFVLSPRPVHHVVVFAGDRNMGGARYPVIREDVEVKRPEYGDPWSGFAVKRLTPIGPGGTNGRIVVYSGDEVIGERYFKFDVIDAETGE